MGAADAMRETPGVQLFPREIGPHEPARASASDDAPCGLCGVLLAHHDGAGSPSLATPAARQVVRAKLTAAQIRLVHGKGLYAEASMYAGWLNAAAEPAEPAA